MIKTQQWITATFIFCAIFLQGCGSDAHGAYSGSGNSGGGNTAPTAPANLAGNAGDGAVNLGWDAPTTGSAPFTYNVTVTPEAAAATIISNGTHAIIRGLDNDTTYTIAVTTKNNAGESTASTISLTPSQAIDLNDSNLSPAPSAITITGDTSPSGIADSSLLNSSGMLWMVYSDINYSQSGNLFIHDASLGLARSSDSGNTFSHISTTIGQAQSAQITPLAVNPCGGNVVCSGHWVYEMPFIVDDTSDPNTSQRFKLFALKHFIVPSNTNIPDQSATSYELGAIVMWTAASLGSNWSTPEQVVLSWSSTPTELVPKNNVNNIDANLSDCLALIEGSATTFQGALDFVFACMDSDGTHKVVMLRSSDHAQTFEYVSTPLTAIDAASFGALYFSAPALLATESSAPILIATPVINRPISGLSGTMNAYSGCIAFAFSDEEAGTVFRDTSAPMALLQLKPITNHMNGACTWERGIGSGILMNDSLATPPFSILNTTARF